jgi:hypothetical protein
MKNINDFGAAYPFHYHDYPQLYQQPDLIFWTYNSGLSIKRVLYQRRNNPDLAYGK